MNSKYLNIGIIHSLIGKNDGVSIVIDQSVEAMVKYLKVGLGNIYFLCAHTSPRFNVETNELFWHKNPLHNEIVNCFQGGESADLKDRIEAAAAEAEKLIAAFVKHHKIDLLIAHNTSHPLNFVTAVALGRYMEKLRRRGRNNPRLLVWWHDSYFERERFSNPSEMICAYLKYLPGNYVDGLVFINRTQQQLAEKYLRKYGRRNPRRFLECRSDIIPNTCDIPWDWKHANWNERKFTAPPQDSYNDDFFRDIGLLEKLREYSFELEDAFILLQHTRIVPRKRIECAIELAFELSKKSGRGKCVVLLVSGHSGDEEQSYKNFLKRHYHKLEKSNPACNVILLFGENRILSHRDIIVDHKYYAFNEVPSIIAVAGGIGTYFSEVEGFGNNLLEMLAGALPVAVNRYEVFKQEIAPLGFDLAETDDCQVTEQLVDKVHALLTDPKTRNATVRHNLQILDRKLHHRLMARKLGLLFEHIFYWNC